MSGYDGYSKSNNAVEAERDHKYPLTRLCLLYGLDKQSVRALIDPCEWHHSSKYFNCVYYYDARDCLRTRYLRRLTIGRPSVIHLYNRLLVKSEMIEEAAGYQRFVSLKNRITEELKRLGALAHVELAKRKAKSQARREAKRQAREAEFQAQLAKSRAEAAKSFEATLRRRCQATGLTVQKIKALLSAPPAADPCCLQSQVCKWFEGWEDRVDKILMEVA